MNRFLVLILAVAALECRAETGALIPNALETVTVFSSQSLAALHDDALMLHAAVEDLFYEPSSSTLATAQEAFDKVYDVYLQTELYGLIGNDGASETHRLINAVSVSDCSPDYADADSVMGLVVGLGSDAELSADQLYSMQANVKGEACGFRVIQFLLASGQGGDNENRKHAFAVACAELLVRNIKELQEKHSVADSLTTGDPNESLATVLHAVIQQAERNQALLANPDCSDDLELSRIIAQNVNGLYQLWIGEYSVSGTTGYYTIGLKSVAESSDSELASRMDKNIRTLFNAARLLGNKKIRRNKDQHLAAFSARIRDKISGLLDEQIGLWTELSGEDAP